MPLPAMKSAKQCSARSKRSGEQCRNPAAWTCSTCRMHGARRPDSIKRGKEHPLYKHGHETLEAKAANRETGKLLSQIAKVMGIKRGFK